MLSYTCSLKRPASTAAAFSAILSGFVVPTIAV
jgi:hypothetical protein